MPRRRCVVSECPEWAVLGTSRCPLHPYKSNWRNRPSTAYRGDWPRLRTRQLREHPACAVCGQPATEVDHIRPLSLGGTHDPANLQSICKACHRKKTLAESHEAARREAARRRTSP